MVCYNVQSFDFSSLLVETMYTWKYNEPIETIIFFIKSCYNTVEIHIPLAIWGPKQRLL